MRLFLNVLYVTTWSLIAFFVTICYILFQGGTERVTKKSQDREKCYALRGGGLGLIRLAPALNMENSLSRE